ncbi:hypothetical protein ACQYWQ_07025 [Streptomyces sp. P6-2-1]|uniref:hypothetical protein n=1 Tax=Streptomyces sp. P6-2-1 TaxID=3422591 RepID=UPI003D35DA7C
MALHYLESLDSQRMRWPGPGGVSAEEERQREHHELQVFTEVFTTLALGLDLVIPQSYAFDSLSFLRVASSVLEARDRVASREHPLRLHLHRAASFEEAVATMLHRTRADGHPLSSGLLPELHHAAEYGLDPGQVQADASSLDRLLNSYWIGDERAEALARIRAEFAALPRVRARPPAVPTDLAALITAAADESSAMSRAAQELSEPFRETHAILQRALRALDPIGSRGFSGRSAVRMDRPWPGDVAGRTPEEIVGGAEPLALVQEFVDTLYNTVVVDSIGTAQATFSTDLTTAGGSDVAARAVAQELALAHYRLRADLPPWLPHQRPSVEQSEGLPLFELRIDGTRATDEPGARAALRELRDTATAAFERLLAARAERPSRGGTPPPFWAGVEDLRTAATPAAAERALERHLARVAGLLGKGGSAGPAEGGLVEISLTSAGAVGPAIATALWSFPGLLEYPATALGAVAPLLARRATRIVKDRRGTRSRARALGRVAVVRG